MGWLRQRHQQVVKQYSVDGVYVGGSVFLHCQLCRPFNNTDIWMLTAHIGSDGLISVMEWRCIIKFNFWARGERLSVDLLFPHRTVR